MLTNELIELASRLADASGPVIRSHFRAPGYIDAKRDGSPVTAADREAEGAIRAILSAERPRDGIIGEEFGSTNPDAELVWVIDPIDGTQSFITGRPIFGTLIALVRDQTPIIGVIDQPVNRERWFGAKGRGTTYNGNIIRSRPCSNLANAVIGTTSPNLFDSEQYTSWKAIAARGKHIVYGGDCYTYAQLAGGFVDVVMEAGLKAYDFCALALIVGEAGGVVTDWSGNPLTLTSDGTVLACGDSGIHAEILSELGR
ncbi:MAG: histidinol-phosphatase [Pseudomonadota bacterium]|nr:histidinol-phosphatase [Pseudomonadota bacterium]